jgi:hypothetical protein
MGKLMHTTFQHENLKISGHLGDLDVDGRIILKCNIKIEWKLRTEFIMFRIEAGDLFL